MGSKPHPKIDELPVAEHGLIGNTHTAALVGVNGAIDFLCWPQFDSASLFAGLLDTTKGGFFQIAPADHRPESKQFYWPDTNILVTRFLSDEGVSQVLDFMPVRIRESPFPWRNSVVRLVEGIRGDMNIRIRCYPAFQYAKMDHTTQIECSGRLVIFKHSLGQVVLSLITDSKTEPVKFRKSTEGNGVEAEFLLSETHKLAVELQWMTTRQSLSATINTTYADYELLFHTNLGYWRKWLKTCNYQGYWKEMVHRSALVLKLLTFTPTGAIIASPTFGLPAATGPHRNADYRYAWVRDSSFVVYSLLRIGLKDEAIKFMHYIGARTKEIEPSPTVNSPMPLHPIYCITGLPPPEETDLPHLAGHGHSGQVRIGNNSYKQLQLDIIGEAIDALYVYNKWAMPVSHEAWQHILEIVDWLCTNWTRPDHSIWQLPEANQYVYSKLMCWVALDRAIRLSENRSFPLLSRREMTISSQGDPSMMHLQFSKQRRERWYAARDEMFMDVVHKGWNPSMETFVQSYGSKLLDASLAMMPLLFFLAPTDPKMSHTIEKITAPPQIGGLSSGGLTRRYRTSNKLADETLVGTYNAASFWTIEALARSGGEKAETARLRFENMLTFANHLGLYSEELDPSGVMMGNFPHAITHMALISAAFNLSRKHRAE